jgi:hypothetical protein
VELDPTAYFVFIDIGNLLLKRGARNQALQAYTQALRYAPNATSSFRSRSGSIFQKLSHSADGKIPPLRNPAME